MRLALYEPDIPQNVGAVIRMAACLDLPLDLIEPFGFIWSEPKLRRAGMDYLDQADIRRYPSWERYVDARPPGRLVLVTTYGDADYHRFGFRADDALLFGRESAGVPEPIHAAVNARVRIPLRAGLRSINLAQAAAMLAGEALRQTDGFPAAPPTRPDIPPAWAPPRFQGRFRVNGNGRAQN